MTALENIVFIAQILASAQGVVVGGYLLVASKRSKPTFLLGICLFLFSLAIVPAILKNLNIWEEIGFFKWFPFRNIWLLSPIFFLYTQRVSIFKKSNSAYWMFVPGLLLVIIKPFTALFPENLFGLENFNRDMSQLFFFTGHFYCFFIGFLNIKYIDAHIVEVNEVFSSVYMKELKWARTFVYFGLLLCATSILVLIFSVGYNWLRLPLVLAQLIAVYWLSFYGTKQHNVQRVLTNAAEYGLVLRPRATIKKPKKEDKELGEVMVRLQELFQEKKPYSDPELTIVDVSVALNVHPKIISKAINSLTGKNFNRFVNSFRINRAKVLLKDTTMKNITIDGVGREVGFQSKSSFYGAFKTMVETTPLEYQKQHFTTK